MMIFNSYEKENKGVCKASKRMLILGRSDELIADLPALFSKLGFSIDILVVKFSALRLSRFVEAVYLFTDQASLIEQASSCMESNLYDWVIVGDDPTLGDILNSSLNEKIKEKLLPVISKEFFSHLYSKTELSNYLQAHEIPTPAFSIVKNKEQALEAANKLSYPLVLKIDQSGGCWGVHCCKNDDDIEKLKHLFTGKKILVQKYIEGQEIAINALYLNAKLIHFDYSTVEKRAKKYGVSILRCYRVEMLKDEKLKGELEQLGKALGIHGFVNISCLLNAQTGSRSYIEADIRPTAWSVYSKYDQQTLVEGIRHFFSESDFSEEAFIDLKTQERDETIPHYLRIRFWEILINRYRVWHYMIWDDFFMMLALLTKRHLILPLGKRLIKWLPRKIRKSASLSFHQRITL